jgi:hypothetical protein
MAFTGPLLCEPSRRAARARLLLLILIGIVGWRMLVPVGFMPATDGTLSVTICTDGLPMGSQQHPQGHKDADGDAYCAFTLGFSSAPPPALVAALGLLIVCLGVIFTRVLAPAGNHVVHIPQARAPPAPF